MADPDSTLETRACKKCGVEKPLQMFHRHPTCVGGRLHSCAKCMTALSAARAKNCEKTKKRKSEWAKRKWASDPEYVQRVSRNGRAYFSRPEVKEVMRLRAAARRAADPERAKRLKNEFNKRRALDPRWCLDSRIRTSVRRSVRLCRMGKAGRNTYEILGYSLEEARAHLEKQFLPGMTWENMGSWHIDHIVPLSSFAYDSVESPEFKRAWALPNLRPLWAKDNLKKQAKITHLL